jgi:hypothetical protein
MKADTLVTLFVPRPINYRDGRAEIIVHRITEATDFVSIPGGDIDDRRVIVRRLRSSPWQHLAGTWQVANTNNEVARRHGYLTTEGNL